MIEPSNDSVRMLIALNTTGKHIYAGTVPEKVKQKRRARNRIARMSRRINRK